MIVTRQFHCRYDPTYHAVCGRPHKELALPDKLLTSMVLRYQLKVSGRRSMINDHQEILLSDVCKVLYLFRSLKIYSREGE